MTHAISILTKTLERTRVFLSQTLSSAKRARNELADCEIQTGKARADIADLEAAIIQLGGDVPLELPISELEF